MAAILEPLLHFVTAAQAAAPIINPIGTPLPAGLPTDKVINGLYDTILKLLTNAAGGTALLYIIWHGIGYISAGGSPEKVKAARAGVINGIIGIVIVLTAYAIIRFAASVAITINNAVK